MTSKDFVVHTTGIDGLAEQIGFKYIDCHTTGNKYGDDSTVLISFNLDGEDTNVAWVEPQYVHLKSDVDMHSPENEEKDLISDGLLGAIFVGLIVVGAFLVGVVL